MGNESFINAVCDVYTVEDIMNLLNLDDEYIIKHFLKSLVLSHRDEFVDVYDMECQMIVCLDICLEICYHHQCGQGMHTESQNLTGCHT